MTGLNHALTGALVAASINRPIIALPAALASHFVIDAIPHWLYQPKVDLFKKNIIRASDLILSLILIVLLSVTVDATPWVVFLGGVLGILPDFMWIPYFLTGKPSAVENKWNPLHLIRRFHLWVQWAESDKVGIYFEVVWFLITFWLIYQI